MRRTVPHLINLVGFNNSLFFYAMLVLILIPGLTGFGQQAGNTGSAGSELLKSAEILVIVPHPDDETLGFAGIIHDARMMGKKVTVVIVTNGDGYGSACYFWKYGHPEGISSVNLPGCSQADFENFGKARIRETASAMDLLGLETGHLVTFGYPDGWMQAMFNSPDSVFSGNTTRHVSSTGNAFCGNSLLEDLKKLFRAHPSATVFTMHILDHHDDHSALARFVQKAREELVAENIVFPVYWSVIHEPGWGNNNRWPPPIADWEPGTASAMQQREQRYQPSQLLDPPVGMGEEPVYYFMSEGMWTDSGRDTCLMRLAVDKYKTSTGNACIDGSEPDHGYAGWLDRNGFLLSFIRKNHLFWKAPFPQAPSSKSDR